MSRHSHFIVGVSIGTGIEPTALAVVEQIIDSGGNWLAKTRALELRHLERLPAQTSYPDTVERVATLLSSSEIDENEGCGDVGVCSTRPARAARSSSFSSVPISGS